MDTVEISKVLSSLPLTVLLFLVLIGGYVEWWIYGSLYRKEIKAFEVQIVELKQLIADTKIAHEKIIAELKEDVRKWEGRALEGIIWDGETERRKKS